MENINWRNYFWAILDLLLLVAVVNVLFFVMPAIDKFGASMQAARTLSVSAEGKTNVSPDLAEASFSVVSKGMTPEAVSKDSNEKMNAVIANIKSNGIDAKDIKTTGYNLEPMYNYDQKTGQSSIYAYRMTQTVNVKIHDFNKIGQIVAGVTALGVNEIGGVSFSVEDEDKVLSQARDEAFAKAKAKAESIAKASGVSLGRVMSVSEYQNSPIPFYGAKAMGMGGADVSAPAPSIEPGTQELKLNVSVTYEIK